MMTTRSLTVAALLATIGAFAACFSERATGPNGTTPCDGTATPCAVEIRDNSFSPSTRRVTVGSTVRWTNDGASAHTTTGPDWDSGAMSSGATFEEDFPTAGTFAYECIFHSGMTGTIVVE